jgi:hypothetical protein
MRATPALHLETLFVLNDDGRIISTREPGATGGPLFSLVRSAASCIWAARVDVPSDITRELDCLAREEPPVLNLERAPLHADRYVSLLQGMRSPREDAGNLRVSGGPAFTFPDLLEEPLEVVPLNDERLLHQNFRGWVDGEIAAGRGPAKAILRDGCPVSVCFCARSSDLAAEAGVETAEAPSAVAVSRVASQPHGHWRSENQAESHSIAPNGRIRDRSRLLANCG